MKPPMLYVLVHENFERFKVGVSGDPSTRWKTLGCPYDPERSFCMSSKKSAHTVERVIHTVFSQFNQSQPGDGGTEWFDVACLDQVVAFIDQHKEGLGLGEPIPVPPPRIFQPPTTVELPLQPAKPKLKGFAAFLFDEAPTLQWEEAVTGEGHARMAEFLAECRRTDGDELLQQFDIDVLFELLRRAEPVTPKYSSGGGPDWKCYFHEDEFLQTLAGKNECSPGPKGLLASLSRLGGPGPNYQWTTKDGRKGWKSMCHLIGGMFQGGALYRVKINCYEVFATNDPPWVPPDPQQYAKLKQTDSGTLIWPSMAV